VEGDAPFWDDVEPQLIDREMAQSYAKRRGMAAATIRYELGMLSVALRWAVSKGHIRKAPDVWRPQPPERRVRHLTRAEFERGSTRSRLPHARLYVELGLATMARPTAILELTWDRVDFERGTVDLNPADAARRASAGRSSAERRRDRTR
jgi:integrase